MNVLKVAFVATITMVSGINVFNAQKTNELSDIALANVEALASGEQPDTKRCIEADSDCIALHPTDESLDKTEPNKRWPTTDYKD